MEFSDRIRQILASLKVDLVERDIAVRLALLAALAGEHLLLVGPPGTAKSLVARRLRHAFKNASYFERLLTRFSVPEELFGPLSIKGLEEDRYERLTESYLPTASIAFLDEIFKANSAILNALLTLLNEREFDNGTRRQPTPLMAVVAASNELPEGEELDALFDRFLLRLHVGPVSKKAFPSLLELKGDDPPRVDEDFQLIEEDLNAIRKKADNVRVPDDVTGLLCDLRDWCAAEKIPVSDRRWRKVVKLLRTSAQAEGRNAVSIWDCWLLQHCLWSKVEDREKIYEWYASRVGATVEEPSKLSFVVSTWEKKLQDFRKSKSQKQDEKGEPLYMRKNGKEVTDQEVQDHRGEEPLYEDPRNKSDRGLTKDEIYKLFRHDYNFSEYMKIYENHPLMIELKPVLIPTEFESDYISKCIEEMKKIETEMKNHKVEIGKRIANLESDIYEHIWVVDSFIEPASQRLKEAISNVEKLLERMEKLIKGYDELPKKTDVKLNGDYIQ